MSSSPVRTVVFRDRDTWRRWLRLSHKKRREIWLVIPKKSAGRESYRVYYNAALEEAICYGWIDSRIRPLDETRSLVRFTPRKTRDRSDYNLKRAQALIDDGKMTKAGFRVLPERVVQKIMKERTRALAH